MAAITAVRFNSNGGFVGKGRIHHSDTKKAECRLRFFVYDQHLDATGFRESLCRRNSQSLLVPWW